MDNTEVVGYVFSADGLVVAVFLPLSASAWPLLLCHATTCNFLRCWKCWMEVVGFQGHHIDWDHHQHQVWGADVQRHRHHQRPHLAAGPGENRSFCCLAISLSSQSAFPLETSCNLRKFALLMTICMYFVLVVRDIGRVRFHALTYLSRGFDYRMS